VTCGDATYDETLVFDETGALVSGTTPLTDLPVGMACTVVETTTGGGEVTYTPNGGTPTDPPTVTIVEDQEVTVTVTNTFREDEPLGAIDVVKVIGEGPEPEPGAEFTIEVDCSVDSFDTTLRFDETGALISGTTPIFGLPLGTTCTVTETGEGGATGVVYDPFGTIPEDPPTVTVDEAALVTVTVTNTFTDSGPVVTTTLPDDDDDGTDGDGGVDDGTAAPERPGGASGLARTGANVFGPVALAGALVGGGYGLLAWRRRLGQR
jgi:hypothetical protein